MRVLLGAVILETTMKVFSILFFTGLILFSCDDSRVYEKNADFEERYWLAGTPPEFEFTIDNPATQYNLYCNIRNEVAYPKANLYFTYYLTDSTGIALEQKLISEFLFDKKTGEPFGSSGLGDIYDHQIPLLKNYTFKYSGRYKMKFEQFMRMDTLPGIIAVGLRVEHAELKESQQK